MCHESELWYTACELPVPVNATSHYTSSQPADAQCLRFSPWPSFTGLKPHGRSFSIRLHQYLFQSINQKVFCVIAWVYSITDYRLLKKKRIKKPSFMGCIHYCFPAPPNIVTKYCKLPKSNLPPATQEVGARSCCLNKTCRRDLCTFPELPNPSSTPQPSEEELNCRLNRIYVNLPGVAAALIKAAFHFLVVDVEINKYITEQRGLKQRPWKELMMKWMRWTPLLGLAMLLFSCLVSLDKNIWLI